LQIEVGFFNWINVGIVATTEGGWRHESHPGCDVRFLANHHYLSAFTVKDEAARKSNSERWQKNKYSIYADIGLGLLFFVVGKITGDLVQAALIGAAAGLGLVVVQRFVKVDLLGGFAVFGTVMLLVSAGFSLAFQSEFMVQMKSTVLGLLTAVLFLGDGLLRGGRYFGQRMQRYMPAAMNHARFAVGLGLLGLFMAGANYVVAKFFSEDFWLLYSTFLDMPLSIILAYVVFFVALEKSPRVRL
jgi:intracellular septation protein A